METYAYRSRKKRQRCLAHLIRKAVAEGAASLSALTGAVEQKAAQIGQWILDDLRELIAPDCGCGIERDSPSGKTARSLN